MPSYVKQVWRDDDPETPASAARMEHIEDGVEAAHDAVDALGTPDVEATPDTAAKRDATGALAVGAPTSPEHAVPQSAVEPMVSDLVGGVGIGAATVLAPTGDDVTDQTTALQSLINSATTFGAVVALRGRHVISSHILVPSGARIDGSRGTIRQTSVRDEIFRGQDASNVEIRNVTAYGLGTDFVNTSSVYLASAVYMGGTGSGLRVINCNFLNFAGGGVYVAGTFTDTLVHGCKIVGPQGLLTTDNFGAGVSLGGGAASVINNDIDGFSQGITSGDVTDIRIIGNRITNTAGQHGIYIHSTKGGVINNNLIRNTRLQGIKIQISKVESTSSEAITVSNNVIIDAGLHGMILTSIVTSPAELVDVIVSNNVITRSPGGDGLVLQNLHGARVSGNVISGTISGLRITLCTKVDIADNLIRDTTKTGIRLLSTSDWTMVNNTVINAASSGTSGDCYGIYVLDGATRGVVRGNRVTNPAANPMLYGVFLPSTADHANIEIVDNVATGAVGATAYGWRGTSTPTPVKAIRGNVFEGQAGSMQYPPSNFTQNADTSGATLSALETEVNELKAVMRAAGLIRT